ncbi:LOW QUALITY PROTEIN: Fanconi anemia core complex-associated protein 100 [Gouania willdenowi]|uniref:LOW QUALITY PROTEIN: Fanconi anemia core complex-associated protein 100 n=1 Tax=Gouania willdenowi TaxID=441366 RepID=UPI001054FDF1|nr:LOW QUALITY PROTEIN: Fanconi anemia core complex-associated protein 100 [Gouania willdenowi]
MSTRRSINTLFVDNGRAVCCRDWAQFGFAGPPGALKVLFVSGLDVLICNGSCEVYVFNTEEKKLRAVLHLPEVASDVVESQSQQMIYVSCGSGVYGITKQFLLHRAQSSTAETSSSPSELTVPSECLIAGADGGSSLLVIDTLLMTLCQRNSQWQLTLYQTSKQTQRFCSVTLPTVSAAVDGISDSGLRSSSVLICIHCGDAAAPTSSSQHLSGRDSRHCCLEPILFKLLFGWMPLFAKSPVILCGLSDGRLCFLPLKPPPLQIQVLHSLEQRVAFVGACVLGESGVGYANCLVAVGERGKVVLIKTDKACPEEGGGVRLGVTELCVSGPVLCCCVDKNRLYYSIGSDLLDMNLSKGLSLGAGKERDKEAFCEVSDAIQSPVSLNVCRVIALASGHAEGKVQLLGLSVRGQLQTISLAVRGEDADVSKPPSNQGGRSVRDFLSAIGDVCERASALKTLIQAKNQTLKHLNQVLNICFLLMEDENEKHFIMKEKPIRCHARTHWTRLLQTDSLNLSCVLVNSSPYILERGWTLSVTVSPLSHSPTAGGKSPATHFTFPFSRLSSGETLDVSLPLSSAEDASFPMTVSCSLIFSASGLLSDEDAVSFSRLQGSCTSLHLNTLTVDWLHTLQVINASQKTGSSPSISSTGSVQGFINSRRQRFSAAVEQGEKQETYSARVRLWSELLKDTVVFTSSDLDSTGEKSVCVCLIDWLLCGNSGGVTAGLKDDKTSCKSALVHARAPNGATIKLTAKEVKVGGDSVETTELLNVTEVQVESSSIAAVCGIHQAVLSRIQTLLLKTPEKTPSFTSQTLGLRQALRRAEAQQGQISDALSNVTSTGTNLRLLKVYRELRENPLLIV